MQITRAPPGGMIWAMYVQITQKIGNRESWRERSVACPWGVNGFDLFGLLATPENGRKVLAFNPPFRGNYLRILCGILYGIVVREPCCSVIRWQGFVATNTWPLEKKWTLVQPDEKWNKSNIILRWCSSKYVTEDLPVKSSKNVVPLKLS